MTEKFPVLYEDEELLVLNKPAGISTIPERYEVGIVSVLDVMKDSYPEIAAAHRIDKETSGVLVLCKTAESLRSLSDQFSRHLLRKVYHALVLGRPGEDEFVCEAFLQPDGDRKHRTLVRKEGKVSLTRFSVIERFRTCTLVEALPETGRIHQIRAHLAHVGFPVLCDPLYGSGEPLFLSSFKRGYRPGADGERPLLPRLALHALRIEFTHPRDGREVRIEAPYPKDFSAALNQLRKYGRHIGIAGV